MSLECNLICVDTYNNTGIENIWDRHQGEPLRKNIIQGILNQGLL